VSGSVTDLTNDKFYYKILKTYNLWHYQRQGKYLGHKVHIVKGKTKKNRLNINKKFFTFAVDNRRDIH